MNHPLTVFGLLGVGVGLTAGLIYQQRSQNGHATHEKDDRTEHAASKKRFWHLRSGGSKPKSELEHSSEAKEGSRLALLPNPAPSRTRLAVGAGSGALAAWGAARGGLIGSAAGLTGAALLSRIAAR